MNKSRLALFAAIMMLLVGLTAGSVFTNKASGENMPAEPVAVGEPIVQPTPVRKSTNSKKAARKAPREQVIYAAGDERERKSVGDRDADRRSSGKVSSRKARKADDEDQERADGQPKESKLVRSGKSFDGDLRELPYVKPVKQERPEREEPIANPSVAGPPSSDNAADNTSEPPLLSSITATAAPAPATLMNFDGLDYGTWGAGHPPDTNGDVGPTYFIQSVNTSIGIYRKSDGVREAAFTFNTFMSQGNFGNLCDTNNFGDPVVLYDSFEDRWIITDFAFQLDGGGNVINPPGSFQCFAASKTGDPVSGGWNFYSVNTTGGLGDYPKFGIWPDGLYMTTSMFGYGSGAAFQNPRAYALNKAQMYAGSPTVQVVSFNLPSADFTVLPSNARLQTGTPPAGAPNYYLSTWEFLNGVTVYKFHVDWKRISLSSFTGPDVPIAGTSWPSATPANAPSLGGNALDVLAIRAMMQNQYTNIGGAESLWATHTVRRANTTGFAAPRWYQVNVTGGTVNPVIPQATTWDPDGANVINRFMPSLAVDRVGNMALGYSTSNSTTKPAIKYAGRLFSDPVNTFSQTEQVLIQGTGTQTGTCGGTCTRWGDYSTMTLDPNGCTFWYTNMYYAVDGLNDLTRIGSFALPGCAPVGSGGTVSGTVTATVGGAAISGATVQLGARSTTTNGSGLYSFANIPAGTYPSITASSPGYVTSTASNIVVTDGATTPQNFSLATAPASACLVDTSQADFQTGISTNTDLTTSPGDITLLNAANVNQQNATVGTSGVGITISTFGGQTFTPSQTGKLTQADINLFCSGCTGTTPNLTIGLRATSGGLPTGADLATATITGFSSGSSAYYTGIFGTPPTLTAGTQYALVISPTSNPSAGTYALTRSGTSTSGSDVYAGGSRVSGATSGTVWSIPLTGGISTDTGFKVYIQSGFAASGDQVSGVKDANPAAGFTPNWTTLSWNATVPANTTLRFQVAGSNNVDGPFNFVGPDSTSATFFTTSGASLSQFNGMRYLKYKAYFATTDNAATPTLNDVTMCFANALLVADLGITKTDGVTTAVPGGSVTYTITASNPGTIAAVGATVADTFPASLTATWTCVGTGGGTCTAAGSGNINDTVNLPAGASVTYTATAAIAASATGTLSNTATVTLAGDPNAANNSATDTDTLTPSADLSITKTDGVTTATAGGSVTYTITASNAGPSNATGATVADTFPASLTATWTCVGAGGGTCTASGSGNINQIVNLPSGGSVTFTASATISAAATGTLSNTATVTAPAGVTDPTPGNNSATDTDALGASADLSITKTDGVTTVTAGGSVTYTITASNAGPSNATGATVADTFPASLTATWTCVGAGGGTCTASGSGNINSTVNLPSGGSVTFTASATISGAATGTLSNTATVTAPAGVTDPTPGNNSATDTDTIGASADLSITKTDGVTTATPGGSVTYTITASNAGPSNATGATVADTFPATLTATWTCAGAGGGTCTASGSGNISDTVNLPSGGSVTYTVSAAIAASATGTLSNTATVTAPAGVTDPTPGNNSATDSDTLTPSANLAITKTDGVTTVTAGGTTTYTIVASNAGPSVATGGAVADPFPAGLICSTTSVAAGGATGNTTGPVVGNINNTGITLPVGASVTYTSVCTVSAAATGSIVNTATVTSAVTDSTPGNNSATDTDTVAITPDLAITKTDGSSNYTAGGAISYTIVVTNNGPSNATGAAVADAVPSSITGVTFNCTAAGTANCGTNGSAGNNLSYTNVSVAAGAGNSVTYTVSGTVAPATTGTLSNTATVTAAAGQTDTTPGNNSATDIDAQNSIDLSIMKTDGKLATPAGSTVTYTIVATNPGPQTASGATVTDILTPSFVAASWTCTGSGGATCNPSGNGNINQSVNLPAGGSVTFLLSATVSPNATGTLSNTATVTVPAGQSDLNPTNNTATDTDTLTAPSSFVIDDVTKNEGQTGTTAFVFTVSKTGATGFATAVQYQTFDGTATVANNDYVATSGTLNFGPNETQKTITVLVNGDTAIEPNETFFVRLSNPPVNAVIGDGEGQGLILNEDPVATPTPTPIPTPTPVPTPTPTPANRFEGDINRTAVGVPGTGDGDVTVADQIQYLRFLNGTDCPSTNEQPRLDAGPRTTLGDGSLGAADGTAIDAYARHDALTDFDPNTPGWQPTPVGGNATIINLGCTPSAAPQRPAKATQESKASSAARILRVVSRPGTRGSDITVEIEMNTAGNEAGTQYSLHFDPSVLSISDISGVETNPDITRGADAPAGTTLNVNAADAANGNIGIVQNFNGAGASVTAVPAGSTRIAKLKFHVLDGAAAGTSRVDFNGSVVTGVTSDVNGITLSSNFEGGSVSIASAAGVSVSGRVTGSDGRGIRGAAVTIVGANGASRTATTSSFGYYTFDDVAAGGTYTLRVSARQYRFASRAIEITDGLADLDFVGLD